MHKPLSHIYCDGSFSKDYQLGVTGLLSFSDSRAHEANEFAKATVKTSILSEQNNIRIELLGAIYALDSAHLAGSHVRLYTDCHAVYGLLARRSKLEALDYRSERSGKPLSNSDLYRQFYALCDRFQPEIILVKGHTPSKDRSFIDQNFRYLDQYVRRILRGVLKVRAKETQ